MTQVKVEYRCKKHPKVILGRINKASLKHKMKYSGPAGMIPEKPMFCPKCERYYYEWECRGKEVRD